MTTKCTSTLHTIYLPHMREITFLKGTSFPQCIHQNFQKSPTTTKPHIGPRSCPFQTCLQQQPGTLPPSFQSPQVAMGTAPWKHSPFITWINIQKGLSQKGPNYTIILIYIFLRNWHWLKQSHMQIISFLKDTFCHNKSDQNDFTEMTLV